MVCKNFMCLNGFDEDIVRIVLTIIYRNSLE